MTDTTTNSNIIPYDDKELITFEDTDNAISMLFMIHESILLKDAKGTTSEVTYLGPNFWTRFLYTRLGIKTDTSFWLMATCYPLWILLISVLFLYPLSIMWQNFQN